MRCLLTLISVFSFHYGFAATPISLDSGDQANWARSVESLKPLTPDCPGRFDPRPKYLVDAMNGKNGHVKSAWSYYRYLRDDGAPFFSFAQLLFSVIPEDLSIFMRTHHFEVGMTTLSFGAPTGPNAAALAFQDVLIKRLGSRPYFQFREELTAQLKPYLSADGENYAFEAMILEMIVNEWRARKREAFR